MNTDDRDRKKAWKAQQRQLAQAVFPISSELLQAMFEAVEAQVDESGCDHTLRFSRQWIAEQHQPEEQILRWLKEHGGFCDCEVVSNVFDHWEKNR